MSIKTHIQSMVELDELIDGIHRIVTDSSVMGNDLCLYYATRMETSAYTIRHKIADERLKNMKITTREASALCRGYEACLEEINQLSKALTAIKDMKVDENTNHADLLALCIVIAQTALMTNIKETHK